MPRATRAELEVENADLRGAAEQARDALDDVLDDADESESESESDDDE